MNNLITNKYYITTIVAIFFSLGLGILIGGTIGQQWINQNQQKLLTFFEEKTVRLQKAMEELEKNQTELHHNYQILNEDYRDLFTNSISHSIDGRKILWINQTEQNLKPLKNTIKLAGGIIYELNHEVNTIWDESAFARKNRYKYDVILYIPDQNDKTANGKWLQQYDIPIIYLINKAEAWNETLDRSHNIFKQRINMDSLIEQQQLVFFLKQLLTEK